MGEVIRRVMAQYQAIREGDFLVRKRQERTDYEAVMGDFAITISDLGVATKRVMDRHAEGPQTQKTPPLSK